MWVLGIEDAHRMNELASKDFLDSHRAQKNNIQNLESRILSLQEEKTSLLTEVSSLKGRVQEEKEEALRVCLSKEDTMNKVSDSMS
jgi:hypothetical protein